MSNYRITQVRMVTQCQNKPNQYSTTKPLIFRCTPVLAVSSTGTAPAVQATAKPARPRKRIPNPAAVDQEMVRRAIITDVARVGHNSDFFYIFIPDEGVRSDSPWLRISNRLKKIWGIIRYAGMPPHQGNRSHFDLEDSAFCCWCVMTRIKKFLDTPPSRGHIRNYLMKERAE